MANTSGGRQHVRDAFIVGLALTAALAGVQYIAFAGLRMPFIPYAMAEIIRDLVPGPIKAVGSETFIAAAKSMIVLVAVALYILGGGGLAALYETIRQKLPFPHWLRGLLLGVLAFVVSVPLELARVWSPSDRLIGPLFLFVLYLWWGLALEQTMRGALSRPDMPHDADSPIMTRRDFLIQTAVGGAVVGIFGGVIGRLTEVGLFDGLRALNSPVPPQPPMNGFAPARGTWAEITPNERFYKVDIGVSGAPKLDLKNWTLRVEGLVDKPAMYTFEQLTSTFTPVPPFAGTLVSISNPVGGDLIGTALWEGVRLADVLNAAGVQASVKDIVFHCIDGYTDSIPVAMALEPDVFLVYRMNGVPLPYEHGFPLRVYSPKHYGDKNPKWVTRIEAVDTDHKGYWQRQGWSDTALIKPTTIINTPYGDTVVMVNPNTIEIGGVAHSGGRSVSKVEVAVIPDDPKIALTWIPAVLKAPLSPYAWTLWKATFKGEPGKRYRVAARLVDGSGTPQDDQAVPANPEGATGYHVKEIYAVAPDPTNEPKPPVAPSPGSKP